MAHLEEGQRRKRGAGGQAAAPEHQHAERERREELPGSCPEVHAEGVKVLSYRQAAQFGGTAGTDLPAEARGAG